MRDFPTVDISEFATRESKRKNVAREVDNVCRQTGFLAIVGHGVSPSIIAGAWRAARNFFDLPLRQKLDVAIPYEGYPYGYAPLQSETLARSLGNETPPDLKESFSIGPLDRPVASWTTSGKDAETAFRCAANLWPREPADFQESWSSYYRAMSELARTMMRVFALALNLPEGFFEDKIDRHTSAMRALNYPPLAASPDRGQLRAGAHSDYGSLTILLTDPASRGLEIYTPDGQWREVPAVAASFIVNIGDLMARWTNDRWVSTLHRVAFPALPAGGLTRRQSIAFFHQPNWDAEISCIPTCLAPGAKAKYAPVRSGPYLMEKFRRTVINQNERLEHQQRS